MGAQREADGTGCAADLAQATVAATAALVVVCDGRGRILLANPAVQCFTGCTAGELAGRLLWDVLVIPEETELAAEAVTEAVSGTARLPHEVTWLAAGGERRQVELQSSVLTRDGVPYATAFVGIDVTEQRAREQSLLRRATTDALTGLANRGALFEALTRAVPGGCGLLFCDLDGFKGINDVHGHGAGDRVLREVAARLRALAREDDVVARLGGDEFVLLRPAGDAMAELADDVRAAMGAPFDRAVPGLRVSASLGTAVARPGDSADDLVARADSEMYGAKRRRYRAAARTGEGSGGCRE